MGEDDGTVTATGTSSTASDCCKSTTACPADKTNTETIDTMSQVVNVCCGAEGDAGLVPVDWLVVCGEDGAPVQVTAEDGTTAPATSECCHTSSATCPDDWVDTDIDTLIGGQMVQVCCASDGKLSSLAGISACAAPSTETVDDSAAPKECLAIAIGMALVGAALQ